MSKFIHIVSAILLAALLLAACASPPDQGQQAITTFAAATADAPAAIGKAFHIVNQSHFLAQQARHLNHFTTYTQVPDIAPFTSDEAIALRVKVFQALADYATLLVDIGAGQLTELDAATEAVGAQLSAFSSGDASLTTPETADAMAAAIMQLGHTLTERKRTTGIAAAAQAADPYVQRVCVLMKLDLDVLLQQLALDEAQQVAERFEYFRVNLPLERPALDMVRRREEIERVFQISQDGKASRYLLVSMKTMLDDLAEAHHGLAVLYGKNLLPQQKARVLMNDTTHLRTDSRPAEAR